MKQNPRRPMKPVVVEAEYEEVKTPFHTMKNPVKKGHKVDVTNGKEVVRQIAIEASDNKEIGNGDMLNAQKPQTNRTVPPDGYVTVGVGLGATLNMGDYQSARVDVFIIRNVQDDPDIIDESFNDMGLQLNIELQRQSHIITGE